jgi:hypothetical protein
MGGLGLSSSDELGDASVDDLLGNDDDFDVPSFLK